MSGEKSSKIGMIVLAAKLGPKILSVGLKLLKSVKVVKLGLAGASAVTYTLMFSWKFAMAIMLLLFVHESGHVWAMRKCGIKTKGFYFIPFFGGAAIAEESFGSRRNETYVALMGPVWGLLLSLVAAVTYQYTGWPLMAALASWMALINLINMLPVNPLDGGRILKSIMFSIGSWLGLTFMLVGSSVAIFLFLKAGIFIFGLLFVIGIIDFLMEYKSAKVSSPGYVDRETAKRKCIMYNRVLSDIYRDRRISRFLNGLNNFDRKNAFEEMAVIAKESIESHNLVTCAPEPASKPSVPGMSVAQVLGYSTCSVIVAACLFSVMNIMDHVPEAALAKSMLFENETSTNVVGAAPAPVKGAAMETTPVL
jgi:Zn-dependent protease